MNAAKNKRMKITRQIHWRSSSGKWAVVAGPFPELFPRSETRGTPEKASKALVDNVYSRTETTRTDQYAKVLTADVVEVLGGSNEFGKVTP